MINISFDKMFLALAIKNAGGKIVIPEDLFSTMEDIFEVQVLKNDKGEAELTLIEGLDAVNSYRNSIAKEQARRRIIVP